MSISDARANLSELVTSVRMLRRCVLLTQRGKPRAAVVPHELGEAINAAGGPDAVLKLLAMRNAGPAHRARSQSGVNASAMECVPSSGISEQQDGHGIPAPPQSAE
jgi:prevent-host-death family protein